MRRGRPHKSNVNSLDLLSVQSSCSSLNNDDPFQTITKRFTAPAKNEVFDNQFHVHQTIPLFPPTDTFINHQDLKPVNGFSLNPFPNDTFTINSFPPQTFEQIPPRNLTGPFGDLNTPDVYSNQIKESKQSQ